MRRSEDIFVLQYYINSSTKGSRGWCWSVAMATYVQRTKLTASLTAPARAAPSTVCVSGRTPASATRATGARTALNVSGREGGRSQVTISYFLSQFARRGGGANVKRETNTARECLSAEAAHSAQQQRRQLIVFWLFLTVSKWREYPPPECTQIFPPLKSDKCL